MDNNKKDKINIENKDKLQASAKLRYLRISPRKVRYLANLIRGMSVNEAKAQLIVNTRKPSIHLAKLIDSAVSNAKEKGMKEEKLYINEIRVDEGPALKRFMPRAMGRATTILKRTSHIYISLKESEKYVKSRFVFPIKSEKKKEKKEKKEKKGAYSNKKENTANKKEEKKSSEIKKDKSEKRRFFRRKSI